MNETTNASPDAPVSFILLVDPTLGQQLAVKDGEPSDRLRVTLVHLGTVGEIGTNVLSQAIENAETYTRWSGMLAGQAIGVGRLSPTAYSDGKDVFFAVVDVPGLVDFRRWLLDWLPYGLDIPYRSDWIPHVKLALLDPTAKSPLQRIDALPISFDSLYLLIGEEARQFKFLGNGEGGGYSRSMRSIERRDIGSPTGPPVKVERRTFMAQQGFEVRMIEQDGKRIISGYGAVYNSRSQVMYLDDGTPFIEKILPGAFRRSILEADVRGLKNHDPNLLLGRKGAGTLRLYDDATGLRYEIDPPKASYALDLIESLERRDTTGSSFSFATVDDAWSEGPDGMAVRELRDVHVFDVGPVTFPAYLATSSSARSLPADDPACRSYGRFLERRSAPVPTTTEPAAPPAPKPFTPTAEQRRLLAVSKLASLDW